MVPDDQRRRVRKGKLVRRQVTIDVDQRGLSRAKTCEDKVIETSLSRTGRIPVDVLSSRSATARGRPWHVPYYTSSAVSAASSSARLRGGE